MSDDNKPPHLLFHGTAMGIIMTIAAYAFMANRLYYPISADQWSCSKQVAISEMLPKEYECVQYTKGEK